jgi:hypothetical protein
MQVRSELSWVRAAILACTPPPQLIRREYYRMDADERERIVRASMRGWCTEQHDYFRKAYPKQRRSNERWEVAGFTLAGIGWAMAGFFFFMWLLHEFPLIGEHHAGSATALLVMGEMSGTPVPDARDPRHPFLTTSALLVVAGGLMLAYKERQFFAEQSRQYERMYGLFRNALTVLHQIMESSDPSLDATRRRTLIEPILLTLGREALSENASWLILHRARPAELMVL